MSMYPIASYTVGANTSNGITFSNIPQTFTHLHIRIFGRSYNGTAGSNTAVQYNGDSGSNYSYHYFGGDGAAVFSGGAASQTSANFGWVAGNNQTAGVFAISLIDILDYTNTNKYKVSKAIVGIDNNGSGLAGQWSGLWLNTAAINQIFVNANGWAQNSTIQIYGVTTSTIGTF